MANKKGNNYIIDKEKGIAKTEEEAHEKALTEICNKLYSALPELDIEVSVSLVENFEMENAL